MKILHYEANLANLDDFILDWEDFAEAVVGEMRFGSDARDKWACRTFPHRLAPELKADLRDTIREKRIRTEEQYLDCLGQEERVDTPNQKFDDLWAIPLILERGELQLRKWRRNLPKYRPLLKQVEDWSGSGEICHLLRDVLPSDWKKRVEDEEKKRAKKRMAARIMSPEEQQPGIMECSGRNLGAPERMISLKNSVYVKVFGETAGGRLLRLNNVQWRRGERRTLQMIPARLSLDSIVQYVSIELRLKSKDEAHIKDRHNHGNHDRCEEGHHPEVQDDCGGSSEDGRGSSGGESMPQKHHEEAHVFPFVAHNMNEHGQDKSKWRRAPPRGGIRKPARRIGNPPLPLKAYRREHDECWICYGKNLLHKHDHTTCKIYAEDKKAYFQAHAEKVPKEKHIEAWKRGQSAGGRSGGQGHGCDRQI